MEVILSPEMGFCQGVRRALRLAEKAAYEGRAVRTLGDIVHNPQVVERLEQVGVRVVERVDDLDPGQAPMVTAHGAPPTVFDQAHARGLSLLDATCPLVKRVQQLAREKAAAGYGVIVCGDPDHAEVKGILGHAGKGATAGRTMEEVRAFAAAHGLPAPWESYRRLAVLLQTTQRRQVYQAFASELARELLPEVDEISFHNTICAAVARREPAARQLAQEVEAMVVVGGRGSANTRHLAETCAATGTPTYQVERAEELQPEWFHGLDRVGVTAGTSTPDEVVAAVVERLRGLGR